ncbi:MAG: delta-aminolevulinic acid dehydratase [Gammaproteobacteria bacterium]|nr:delta-aminolevulinic acid dehydratase [Gammaproteobacteria bacterium]
MILSVLLPVAHTQGQPEATEADCGCLWEGSFSEVAPQADLVVLGNISSVKGNAVDITPVTALKGELWLDPVRVWMKTRDYCRPPVEDFPEGSRWIMALSQIREVPEDGFNPSTPNQSFGRQFDYVLSSCGGYWLRVNGNTAIGNLVPDMPRFYHHPDMSPVLIDLIAGYLNGEIALDTLTEASRERPEEVNTLILDTRSFLRGQEDWLEDESTETEP